MIAELVVTHDPDRRLLVRAITPHFGEHTRPRIGNSVRCLPPLQGLKTAARLRAIAPLFLAYDRRIVSRERPANWGA
jgi:hypothetical protein